MLTSISFLASDLSQLPQKKSYGNDAVEAILFNESQLESNIWVESWKNIEHATKIYGNKNVTFHFPMNGSDYSYDARIYKRLVEAYKRAIDLGIAGVVVHSNLIREIDTWKKYQVTAEQRRIGEKLLNVVSRFPKSDTWLGLENMPIVGNFGKDTDPLFCFEEDFFNLPDEIGIVWDVCHSSSTQAYIKESNESNSIKNLIARDINGLDISLEKIIDRITHWHFAAFQGLNNPIKKTVCVEGVLPGEGYFDKLYYEKLVDYINSYSPSSRIINFEVIEDNYQQRKRAKSIVSWYKELTIN